MSEIKQLCMVMKINVDCNACCKKLRRIILKMKAIEKHLIEKECYRVVVFGRFRPSDIAIKIRKKMNRRVEILDVEEMEPEPAAGDQNPPPPEQVQAGGPSYQIPMFPSLDHDPRMAAMYPPLAAASQNQCRSFSSSRPDLAVTCFPDRDMDMDMDMDMDGRFWHYAYQFPPHTPRPTFSLHTNKYYDY